MFSYNIYDRMMMIFIHNFVILLFLSLSSEGVLETLPTISVPENYEFALEQIYLLPFKKVDDQALTCGQLIESRGFKYERHSVTTEDGYILHLYRIINPYAHGKKLKPVLMVHGFLLSCSSWMINQPDGHIKEWLEGIPPNVTSGSLAFVLANLEYDVWIGNSRGTSYSTDHQILNHVQSALYWNFSFDQMGLYDFPAMINYVIQTTGYEKIVYIGHSQGNLQMFLGLSTDPSLADKLDLNIAIAPIAFFEEPENLLAVLFNDTTFLTALNLLSLSNAGPFPPLLATHDATLSIFCEINGIKRLCLDAYDAFFGFDSGNVNKTRFTVLTSQIDTISSKSMVHYGQVKGGKPIARYDYGPLLNLVAYGTEKAPVFNYSRIPAHNLVLISGRNDLVATLANVEKLKNQLQDPPLVDYVVPYPAWNHLDPIFGLNAYENCHSVIVDYLRKYVKF